MDNALQTLENVWRMIAQAIGPILFQANHYINTISLIAAGLCVLSLLAVRMHERQLLRRYQAGMGRRRSSLASRLVRSRARKRVNEEEFEAIMKMPYRIYFYQTLGTMAIGAAVSYFLLGSWGAALLWSFGAFFWRAQGSRVKVDKARNESIANELMPDAIDISNAMLQGMSLPESVAALVRGIESPSSFKRSLRRALASANGAEAGLRVEQELAYNDIAREFFEILADGASTTRRKSTTADILIQFHDANSRRQQSFGKALTYTAQARGARNMMLALIPATLFISGLRMGLDVLFHTYGGNITILIIGGLLLCAFILTNGVINGALKEF